VIVFYVSIRTTEISLGLLEWLETPLYYKNSQRDNPICSTRDEITQPSRPISPRVATAHSRFVQWYLLPRSNTVLL